jgi:4'-phosphopantetheinyl transferase EntD
LGVPEGAILPDAAGAPVWPADVVGSMTHTGGYCAAAVAPAGLLRSIGIDAELHQRLGEDVSGLVMTSAERALIGALPTGTCWDMLSFSAKEAVYKAWYPLTGAALGFRDVEIRIDPERESFRATVHPVAPTPDPVAAGISFDGRFAVRDGVVLTAVALRR